MNTDHAAQSYVSLSYLATACDGSLQQCSTKAEAKAVLPCISTVLPINNHFFAISRVSSLVLCENVNGLVHGLVEYPTPPP